MPRAAALTKASAVNRRKAGRKGTSTGGGVNLPNLPGFNGPPPGTFDPGLEAQVRAAERGLIDLIEKDRIAGRRESADTRQARALLARKVSQGQSDITRNRGYASEDAATRQQGLQINFERDLQDLAVAKQNGEQDYNRRLTEIQHTYATQAARQSEAAVAQGTNDAPTSAASGAVRGANQGWDQSLVDTAHQRALDALALSEGRDRQDFARQSGLVSQGLGRDLTRYGIDARRLGLEAQTQRGQLRRDLGRGRFDRATELSHAKREYGIYTTDVAQQAYYQAHQLNPNIRFPIPAGTPGVGATTTPGVPHGPALGAAVHYPHVHNPVARNVGLGPARSRPRRPYTRY